MKMKKGEKCIVMVPAALAYGSEVSSSCWELQRGWLGPHLCNAVPLV